MDALMTPEERQELRNEYQFEFDRHQPNERDFCEFCHFSTSQAAMDVLELLDYVDLLLKDREQILEAYQESLKLAEILTRVRISD